MKLKRVLTGLLSVIFLVPHLTSCSGGSKDWFNDTFGDVVDTIKEWGKTAWDNTISWGQDAWGDVSDWTTSAWKDTVSWSKNTGEAVADWTKETIDGATQYFCNVGDYVLSVKDKVVGFGLKKGVDSLDLTKGLEDDDGEPWKDYGDDFEAISYALLTTQLEKAYDVFPAKLYLPSNHQEVYGYCFTDGTEIYTADNDDVYFGSGFLSLADEPNVSDDDIQQGIEIYRVNDDSSDVHYFYSYKLEAFHAQCVINKQYLKYGINENSEIEIEHNLYQNNYDADCGPLYSFDEEKYLVGSDEDNGFVPAKMNIVDEAFDFSDWSNSFKRVLKDGFSIRISDLKAMISKAITTVKTVYNNINEQTVLGYNIDDIKNAISHISESDIATVDEKKVAMHSVDNSTPTGISDTAKWIVGVGTAIVVICDIAISIFFPKVNVWNVAINTAMNAVTGAAIEAMVQLLFENKNPKDINWIKIAISAAVGGICTLVTDIKAQSLIIAATNTVYSFMDGATFLDCSLSFVSSFVIALIVSSLCQAIANGLSSLAKKLAPKLTNKVTAWVAKHQVIVGGKTITETNNPLVASAKKQTENASKETKMNSTGKAVFNVKQAVKQLPSDRNPYFGYVDEQGNAITKADLLKNGGKGRLVLKKLIGGTNPYSSLFVNSNGAAVSYLPISNGYIQMDDIALVKNINLLNGQVLTSNRTKNYHAFEDALKQDLINNPNNPNTAIVRNYFDNLGIDYENLTYADFTRMLSDLNLTWHESENRTTGMLVDRTLHAAISHMGGISLTKAIIAVAFPNQLLYYASSLAVQVI